MNHYMMSSWVLMLPMARTLRWLFSGAIGHVIFQGLE